MTLRLGRPLVNYFDEINLQTDCICALLQTRCLRQANPHGVRWRGTPRSILMGSFKD